MEIADMYSEVYDILNMLGTEYIEKIPTKLYTHIEKERNKNKINNFSLDKSIENQNINDETMDFIAYLNMQYWTDAEERERLIQRYSENDLRIEQELYKKYNPDNIFKKSVNTQNETEHIHTELVVYKQSIFTKIKNWIKKAWRK